MAAKTEFKSEAHASQAVKSLSSLPVPEKESKSKCNLAIVKILNYKNNIKKTWEIIKESMG